ncbi:MAG: hypothetical protein C0475_07800 [Planctomyces sp.]|nr:hypothetical protein [Planctomyces sp.]
MIGLVCFAMVLPQTRRRSSSAATSSAVRAAPRPRLNSAASRDKDAARERFGVTTGQAGIVRTRTGRRFFGDAQLEASLLERVRASIGAAGLWDELSTSWVCLDCELMPWSVKAQALLREQYAAVGSSARVALADQSSVDAAIEWWERLASSGGEGMVVKPREFITRDRRGPLQPAAKCRGPEYLRMIYGPEYKAPENLDRLRSRGLTHKRSLALREFALGTESLERFVRCEPLRRVHECVFGVLALESEPADPRL